ALDGWLCDIHCESMSSLLLDHGLRKQTSVIFMWWSNRRFWNGPKRSESPKRSCETDARENEARVGDEGERRKVNPKQSDSNLP
ncbi:hypothetical protein BHE74_00047714, partial [Ensete ventricosum]